MKHIFSPYFIDELEKFPLHIQRKFQKQLLLLLRNIRHPSLHAKKYDESSGIWQARADRNIRFYFLIENDTYILLTIKKHPK